MAVIVAVATVVYSPSEGGTGGALAARLAQEGLDTQSDQGRLEFWRIGLAAVRERPVTGYGPGAYGVAYRLFQSPEQIRADPSTVVTDPHDLPVLLLSTTGVPGLVLAAGLIAMVLVGLVRRGRGDDPPSLRAQAALVYAVGAGTFLLFDPPDLGTVVPLVLVGGAALGPPAAGGGWATVRSPRVAHLARLVVSAAFIVAAAALAFQSVAVWRADAALLQYDRTGDVAAAVRSARLAGWWSTYPLVAGYAAWREGAARGAPAF